MLKNHPKGLLVAFFSNMGERFGFYTMMAILVLFLQARYNLDENKAGDYYSWFYFAIYALALVGGVLADATRKYKLVILLGLIVMFLGYGMLAIPNNPLAVSLIALFVIAFGNGLFKGNLQAVVGQMYDDPQYQKMRDTGYMIFYMGINIGAFFAPFVATGIRNWFLKTQGFLHDGSLPKMCHEYLAGKLTDVSTFSTLASKVSLSGPVPDLTAFANAYLDAFSKGYNMAFAIAGISMLISLLIYVIFNKKLPQVQKVKAVSNENQKLSSNLVSYIIAIALMAGVAVLFYFLKNLALGLALGLFVGFVALMFLISTKEERPQVSALVLVFFVVIFFWMSFHQNGLTLTYFARDYVVKSVDRFTYVFFNLGQIILFILFVAGIVLLFNKSKQVKLAGLGSLVVFGLILGYIIMKVNENQNPIAPEIFQSFNPLFIVALTFPVMGIFEALRKKEKEPSTPKKIGIGMIIAALGYVIMVLASFNLLSPKDLGQNPLPDDLRVSPYWLISTYLVLTIAELFLSPMGLSFVSKVAPIRFQGLMQAGWLLATATGNKLLFVGSFFWKKLALWEVWAIFVVACSLSALFIFSILKRLEKATQPQVQ